MGTVEAIREPLTLPTYELGEPERNPMFFDKRVYQGSSGKVYPVPFVDKVHDTPKPREYDSVRLENDWVRLVMLPEIGGRIFTGQDRANDDYEFFYQQDVVKPALVGLAGPWISGGVEFNWPQHHRPGTYMPADVHIEEEACGARTVWLSEHDPITRMKGMHGIRLRPDSSLIELRVRLFNRTPIRQTFLWWANVAARVHDQYQSFFPPDVHYVADHAVRAQSSFPIAENEYYGIDYAARPGENDLSWYKNIPVPTSYMVCETEYDFFGGYDHAAGGGFVHVANRHIAPGKKQWTWGNHEFGWAWDRELTDEGGPYVELMAGVYTDNQPDFTYLAPYETKTFSQFWWPYQGIGPVHNASEQAAVRLDVRGDRQIALSVVAPTKINARVLLREAGHTILDDRVTIIPNEPYNNVTIEAKDGDPSALHVAVYDDAGSELVAYRPISDHPRSRNRTVATEPPSPEKTEAVDQLYLNAEHLEQYRHPTRSPEPYWREALERDPDHSPTHIAIGRQRLRQGDFSKAADHFERAIACLTHRHPNPHTGEAHYYLGVTKQFLGQREAAYNALYKATWDYAFRAAAYYRLATLDVWRGDWRRAIEHCEASLDTNRQNNKAQILRAIAREKQGNDPTADYTDLLAADPLDHWARYASGDTNGFLGKSRNDAQTVLDIAYDYADAGLFAEAISLVQLHHNNEVPAVATPNPQQQSPITEYVLAWLLAENGETDAAKAQLTSARGASPDYLFPSRRHDEVVLRWALNQPGRDANAAFGLGNYLYDRNRRDEAIRRWEEAVNADPSLATAHRNLGIAFWNGHRNGDAAMKAYDSARDAAPDDARIFYEADQLRKRMGDLPNDRLAQLLTRADLVQQRDDASVELAALYNETGQPDRSLELLLGRRFHPWEGGEGQVLAQHKSAHLQLGQIALEASDAAAALEHFRHALNPPENLGEAYHLLQAKADVNYWIGKALSALGRDSEADDHFRASANEAGDFQSMAVTEHSELSYYRGLALLELDRTEAANQLFADLADFAQRQLEEPATTDYFATSLPQLLVFDDDLDTAKHKHAKHLLDLARQGIHLVDSLRPNRL